VAKKKFGDKIPILKKISKNGKQIAKVLKP